MSQKKKQIIFVLSVLVSVLAVLWAVNSIRYLPHYDYSLDDWKSEHAVYKNNGFSADDEIKGTDVRVDFLWGPYKPLKKKNTLTANPPGPQTYPPNSMGKAISSPVIEPACPIMTSKAQMSLRMFTLLLLMLSNSDKLLFINALFLTWRQLSGITAMLFPSYAESS